MIKVTASPEETDIYTPASKYIRINGNGHAKTNGISNNPAPVFEYSAASRDDIETPEQIIKEKVKVNNNVIQPAISGTDDMYNKHIKDDQQVAYRHLSEERMTEIYSAIQEYFAESQPYLKLHYTLQQLSIHMNIPSQYISIIIHEYAKMNFNDFVNKYRVEYCIRIMQNNEHKSQTLEAIARKSGFNNRNTFTLAFKKITGKTPSEYIKSISAE